MPKNIAAPPPGAGGKNAPAPVQTGRMPTSAEIQAMFANRPSGSSVMSRNPQDIINAQRAKRGMQPIDWAARQAAMQAKAAAIANAIRQQQEQNAAAQDPNSPTNPNNQFAGAANQPGTGAITPKNQEPPPPALVGGGAYTDA